MIDTIAVCTSSKFYDQARRAEGALHDLGLTVHTPRYDWDERVRQPDEIVKVQLTREFLAKIDTSDALYVVAVDGYVGTSVTIEVAYTHGQRKPAIWSHLPTDHALRALVDAVVPLDQIHTRFLAITRILAVTARFADGQAR